MFFTKKKQDKKASKKEKINAERQEKLEEGKVLCRTIVELAGKPKEYIVDTLHKYVEKIKQTKGIEVVSENFGDVTEKDGLFGTYVEIEAWFKSPALIVEFCLDYMPSSIEIIEPMKVSYTANQLTNIFNDLQGKLHQIDMMLKQTVAENKILRKNMAGMLRNNIMLSLKEKPKKIEEISKNVGIAVEQLKPFVEKVVAEGFIKENKGIYSLAKNDRSNKKG